MPIPDFVVHLRERIGRDLLWLPGVTAVVLRGDEVLLNGTVHRVDDAERDPLGLSWRLILAEA